MITGNSIDSSSFKSPSLLSETLPHRALILDRRQWNRITQHLRPNKEAEFRMQKDQAYEEYLKNGSRQMTKNWENSIEKIRDRKNAERKKMEEEKKLEVERCFRELKENDEKFRQERITYAENLLKRLKTGPQQLESAYLLSKILHEQELQRRANSERERIERQQNLIEGKKLLAQAVEWIEEQKWQIQRYRGRCAEYMKIIRSDIEQKEKQRLELAKRLVELEKVECEANSKQMQQQLQKECKAMTKRKERLQRDADEAIKWARQRRQSETAKTIEEQKRIDEYLAQKSQQELHRKVQEKTKQKRRIEFRDGLAIKLFSSQPDIESAENELYQKAVMDFTNNWNEQERKKREHIQILKQDRIKYHMEQLKNEKEIKRKQLSEDHAERINRLLNEKIDLIFDCQHRLNKIEKTKKLKQMVYEQIKEQEKTKRDEEVQNRIDTNRAIDDEVKRDDQDFLNYANKLMSDVKAKGRPIYPLAKVLNEYKIQNSLAPKKDDLPHMKSNVDIGISMERKLFQNK